MSNGLHEKHALSDDGHLSQSEEDDYAESHGRTSEDVRRHDQDTLTAEEEAERLLGVDEKEALGIAQKFADRREARSQRMREAMRSKRNPRTAGRSELMYDTEEGRRSSSSEGSNSSEADLQLLKETQSKQRTSKTSRFARFTIIHVIIIATFVALVYGAYHATSHKSNSTFVAQTLSNGTHTFLPTTLLISLDGFRADFLARNLTPTLNNFVRSGVSPRYMTPSFPSLTFPNHYTLVTGLYPESHGVVGNTFWDPNTSKEFYYTDPARSMQREWWNAEPLWVTAELAGVRSAIHMWPGSEAPIGDVEPAYVDKFNGEELLDRKIDRIFTWLDLPGPEDENARDGGLRPQLIAAYVPDVDRDGHRSGPNSTHIRGTIAQVDDMLGTIFRKIDERNLTDIVNIIVVSDHGMATTSINRLIQLEDLIDTSLIEHTDGWPLYGLRPYNPDPAHLQDLYNTLLAKSRLPEYRDSFDVYLRDKGMPARYHFSSNPRIAPLWIVPRVGWAIVTKSEFDIPLSKQRGDEYKPRGLHGYDFEHPLMRAIFVARGPAFPHPKGSRVREFGNTEVYNIVCNSLGIEPRPNNGTLRLPLRTQGLHDFDAVHGGVNTEVPEDFTSLDGDGDAFDGGSGLGGAGDLDHLNLGVPPAMPTKPLPPTMPTDPVPPMMPTEPSPSDDGAEGQKGSQSWWEWMREQFEKIQSWAGQQLGGEKDGEGKDGQRRG